MKDWIKIKEFEIVYEKYNSFFSDQVQVKSDYVYASDESEAKERACFQLGARTNIISIKEI